MSIEEILVCAVILAVAFVFLGFIYSPKDRGSASMKIVPMVLTPTTAPSPTDTLELKALPGGDIVVTRPHLPLREGDTANLVVHVFPDHVKITEKKGVSAIGSAETSCSGEALIGCIGQRWYAYRFESEITAGWCTFEFTNVEGNTKSLALHI